VTTNDVVEQRPIVCLDLLELRSVHLDHAPHALATRERFRRRNGGLRLHEYADQARAVLGGKHPGEREDACCLGLAINEDDYFPNFSGALDGA
jgi:hypothetical protein